MELFPVLRKMFTDPKNAINRMQGKPAVKDIEKTKKELEIEKALGSGLTREERNRRMVEESNAAAREWAEDRKSPEEVLREQIRRRLIEERAGDY